MREPKLLIATRVLGASGQPWLWRQVSALNGFQKHLVCWDRRRTDRTPDGVTVHVIDGDPAPYDGASRWRHRARNLPGRNFYAAIGEERRQLVALLRREQPDLILCYFGDIAMRLLPLARKAGVPMVAYLHGDFQFVDNRWYRWSLKRCLRQFAAIVVVTEAERRWIVEQGIAEDKVLIIPCGAPVDRFRAPATAAESSPAVRFVMASRLSWEKGCDVSIDAFGRVASVMPDAQLHVYGDGPERNALERLVETRHLTRNVVFHGYVEEHDLARALPSFDVFIQHSIQKEGSPVSIVEAMLCGLPVVATPVGGVAAQVVNGETGLLARERDVRSMEVAMRTLAADPQLRRTFGEAGRQRALNLYDSAVLTRSLERLLLDVARTPDRQYRRFTPRFSPS
jgi:glycosyltransferase involved in cell wall biosynthesis